MFAWLPLRMVRLKLQTQTKKERGASLMLVPRIQAFALPRLSKRATLKAPRMMYIIIPPEAVDRIRTRANEDLQYIPRGVTVALFLTDVEVAKFRYVKTKAFSYAFLCICIYSRCPARGLSAEYRLCKYTCFSRKTRKMSRKYFKSALELTN